MKVLALLFLVSCSTFHKRDKERDLQSQMLRALNDKSVDFATCAKKHGLFEKLGSDRIRVELILDINSKGQVEKFQIDNQSYSNEFVDCMFSVADLIAFPKLKKGEMVNLTQPFIFSR
ncbi:MAG: hypothetical protein KC478_11565 [Bacteriovoracaceae bacterium]|nr:hypothetical protein [Bacteriovoracaceae bacterium]